MKRSVILRLGLLFCAISSTKQETIRDFLAAHLREKRSSSVSAPEITVSLKIHWNTSVVNKPVPAKYIRKVQNGTLLVDILNKAAEDNKQGPFNKYDSQYYGGLGYLITVLNGTEHDHATSTYWSPFDEQTGGALPCGVSSYVPRNGSTTIFRHTRTFSGHNGTVTGYCKQFPSSNQVPPSAITVTIELDWNVTSVGKQIPSPYTTKVSEGTVLVDILNKAADENTQGPFNKYTSTYYGGLGHYITSMNGSMEDPTTNTHWMIYDKATGNPVPHVDSYKPQDGSTTIFRLVTEAGHESPTDKELDPKSSGKILGMEFVVLCLLAAIEPLLFF